MAPHSSTLAWISHGWRSLVGCRPWDREGSDTTKRLHFHFSLSCIGEGNGNPLQCSCLENPRDSGAWWAAVYGVAQSRTRLKRLSSSSSSSSNREAVCPGRARNLPYVFSCTSLYLAVHLYPSSYHLLSHKMKHGLFPWDLWTILANNQI